MVASLHAAAELGSLKLVTQLIASGHDANQPAYTCVHMARAPVRTTALHAAAELGDCAVIAALLAAGAKVDATDEYGSVPLHYVESGAAAAALLAAGASTSVANSAGNPPLHIARNGDVAAALLAAGASVSATNDRGETPLHTAQSAAVVSALLAAGASVQARDRFERTPLVAVLSAGMWTASAVDMHCPHRTAVADVASQLIAGGSDLQATCRGRNVLHLAVLRNLPGLVQELLACGLSVQSRDADGHTALHLCAESDPSAETNATAVAQLLVAASADINAGDARGATPLHYLAKMAAAMYWHGHEKLEYLLTAGADAAALDHSGKSALQWLCEAADQIVAETGQDDDLDDNVSSATELLLQAGATAEGLPADALEWLTPVLDSQAKQLAQQQCELAELQRQVAELSVVTPTLQQVTVAAAATLAELRLAQSSSGGGEQP